MKAIALTVSALICFALNSILCRLALANGESDAVLFTLVRIGAGALALFVLNGLANRSSTIGGQWLPAGFLFGYAILFSVAYLSLTAGIGALLLFGSVQITMIIAAVRAGERPKPLEWTGLLAAMCGLVYLVLPGIEAPPIVGAILMILAGVCWGLYTISGRGVADPLAATAGNFARALPMAAALGAVFWWQSAMTARGFVLAAVSGALASGIGYAIWFAALRYHSATRSAILQLSVPAIAAVGGVLFLSETFAWRLIGASALILGGIALTIFVRRKA